MIRILKSDNYRITQPSLQQNIVTGNEHKGCDIVTTKKNCKVIAHSDGYIIAVVKNYKTNDKTGASYGNYVMIKHPNGYNTLYAHLKYGSVSVSVGDFVRVGDVIGIMGNTGRATDIHLHFGVKNGNNIWIKAEQFIENNLPNLPIEYDVETNDEDNDSNTLFQVGDRVLVTNGVATETSFGRGKKTAEYHGKPEEGDVKYITIISKGSPRPYHISNGKTQGEGDRGWVSESQIEHY